jgi:dCTP deaminase
VILSAQTIRDKCLNSDPPLISPFNERTKFNGRSYGLSGCGYDVRLAQDVTLYPGYGKLASIMEHIHLPNYMCAEVKDKSTNARLFVLVQNTVIEPGWNGYLTVELTRFLPWPIKLEKGTPIAQIMFKYLDKVTEQPYEGKYQNQGAGPQKAILEGEPEEHKGYWTGAAWS